MTTIKISACCPYEIGDKIVTEREIHPPELAFKFPAAVRTITDVVCQHSTQTGETVFLYELDGRGPLVRLEAPPRLQAINPAVERVKNQNRRFAR